MKKLLQKRYLCFSNMRKYLKHLPKHSKKIFVLRYFLPLVLFLQSCISRWGVHQAIAITSFCALSRCITIKPMRCTLACHSLWPYSWASLFWPWSLTRCSFYVMLCCFVLVVMYLIMPHNLLKLFQLGMGVLQVGFVVMYLSDNLVSGFTTAAAIHILVSQLKFVLGLQVPGFSGPLAIIYVSTYQNQRLNPKIDERVNFDFIFFFHLSRPLRAFSHR